MHEKVSIFSLCFIQYSIRNSALQLLRLLLLLLLLDVIVVNGNSSCWPMTFGPTRCVVRTLFLQMAILTENEHVRIRIIKRYITRCFILATLLTCQQDRYVRCVPFLRKRKIIEEYFLGKLTKRLTKRKAFKIGCHVFCFFILSDTCTHTFYHWQSNPVHFISLTTMMKMGNYLVS